jgi:hypothetical protein
MSPSSTSSSDPDADASDAQRGDPAEQSAPAPILSTSGRRALLLCLGLLLLLELGAARRDWVWRLDPRRPVGIMLAVEDEIIAPAADDARVIALGSSVMRDALLPRAFEEAAGLPPGSVLNTSLPNATPFDFVLLYRRNRAVFAHARLLLVGVEDWYFYEEPGVSERYHRWASLSERLADYTGAQRLPVLVSWLWQTYAARQAFTIQGITGEIPAVIGPDGRTRWRPEEQESGPESFDLSQYEARLRAREWRDRQVRYLLQLLQLAAADRVPVLVLRMPMRDQAFELRARVDPEAEERLQDVLAQVRGAAGAPTLLDLPTAAAAGLQPTDFLDERHLGTSGARRFSSFLAGWAAERYALR